MIVVAKTNPKSTPNLINIASKSKGRLGPSGSRLGSVLDASWNEKSSHHKPGVSRRTGSASIGNLREDD